MENQKQITKEEFFQKLKARDERIKALFMQGKAANEALQDENARLLSRVNFLQAQLSETAARKCAYLEVIGHFMDGLQFSDLAPRVQTLIKEDLKQWNINTAKTIKAKKARERHSSLKTLTLLLEAFLARDPHIEWRYQARFCTNMLSRAVSDLRRFYRLEISDKLNDYGKVYFLPNGEAFMQAERILEPLKNEIREREARKARQSK